MKKILFLLFLSLNIKAQVVSPVELLHLHQVQNDIIPYTLDTIMYKDKDIQSLFPFELTVSTLPLIKISDTDKKLIIGEYDRIIQDANLALTLAKSPLFRTQTAVLMLDNLKFKNLAYLENGIKKYLLNNQAALDFYAKQDSSALAFLMCQKELSAPKVVKEKKQNSLAKLVSPIMDMISTNDEEKSDFVSNMACEEYMKRQIAEVPAAEIQSLLTEPFPMMALGDEVIKWMLTNNKKTIDNDVEDFLVDLYNVNKNVIQLSPG